MVPPRGADHGLTLGTRRTYRGKSRRTCGADKFLPSGAPSCANEPACRPQGREPRSEQAHVSAQQPPPGEDPWVPSAHAHPRRPGHPHRPPLQGARSALGLSDVLPADSRLRHRADFSAVTRSRGVRGRGLLVVHTAPSQEVASSGAAEPEHQAVGDFPGGALPCRDMPRRAGLVVPRSVGPAVTRNRVKRRLRHLLRPRLATLPAGTRVVVRALPASATATSPMLAAALDEALARSAHQPPSAGTSA